MPHPHVAPAWLAVTCIALAAHAAQARTDGPPSPPSPPSPIPPQPNVTTLVTTPLSIEGLTGDRQGNLYTPGRSPGAGLACPVWRIALTSVTPVLVGQVPAPSATAQCNPSGLAFDRNGVLHVSEADRVYALTPSVSAPPLATVFASGLTGTNGLAFDTAGNLWTGDGTAGLGRVWRITPAGVVTEMFRVPPMANPAGVGRSNATLPTGNAQPLVANGLAFDRDGSLLVADTARGALWRVRLDAQGQLASPVGCDTTFSPNTLCFDNVWAAHPWLEGVDGIALDRAGNVWAAVNERNALVVVQADQGRAYAVLEAYRNRPDATTGLRNAGPLEFPTSPFLLGTLLCTANSDGGRRDNAPTTAGEIGGAGQPRGKVSCLDPRLAIPGLSLPVQAGVRD